MNGHIFMAAFSVFRTTIASVLVVLFAWWHESSSCKSFRPVDDVMCKNFFPFLQSYFKDSWNTFDFVTVVGSIVDALMVEFAVSKKAPLFYARLNNFISPGSCSSMQFYNLMMMGFPWPTFSSCCCAALRARELANVYLFAIIKGVPSPPPSLSSY